MAFFFAILQEWCFPELFPRQFQTVLDGYDCVVAADMICQLLCQVFGHRRVVDTGHVDEENIFFGENGSV